MSASVHAGIYPPRSRPPRADTPQSRPPQEQTPWSRPPGSRPPPDQTPPGADTPGADTHPDQTRPPRSRPPQGADIHPPQDQTPPSPLGSRLQHTVNERPVRILLECILVIINHFSIKLRPILQMYDICWQNVGNFKKCNISIESNIS